MTTRKFKVIDSSGIGMGVSFQDQVLDYLGDSMIPGCVVLKQPPFDANGNSRSGVVTFGLCNLRELTWVLYEKEPTPGLPFVEDLDFIQMLIGSILYETMNRDGKWYIRRLT